MPLFLKRYLGALLSLALAMSAYCLVVVPVVEPPGLPEPELPTYVSSVATDRWWNELFEPGTWQTGSPSLLQSSRGILLAESWEQIDPRTLSLRPLTIIIPHSKGKLSEVSSSAEGTDKPSVWIVSAREGATIHFETDFDAKTEPVPSIASGELTGEIRITRKTIGEVDARPWTLETRDLFIESGQVRTSEQVRIKWDDSIISGRDLKIELLGDLFSPDNDTAGRWGPLDKLELFRVEKVDIGLPNGGIWSGLSKSLLPKDSDIASLPARLNVNCNGRFAFDFRRSTATLTEGVQIHHLLGDKFRDEFSCQQLAVTLADDSSTQPLDEPGISLGDLRLESLKATGIDQLEKFRGEKKVELKAPSIGAYAAAKRLSVVFATQRVEFDGQLATPGATQSVAWLRYGPYEFRSPRIEYDADGEDKNPNVEHLGYLIASGPGELNISEEHEMGTTDIRWQDSLRMMPTADPQQQWIGIFGKTLVESRRHGFVTSDKIEVWLRKLADTSPAAPGTNLASESYQPDNILASGNVSIEASGINAKIDSLHLGLVFQEKSQPNPVASQTQNEGDLALSNSEGYGMYQWVGPPTENTAAETAPAGLKDSQPVLIRGSRLTSRIVLAGKRSWIDDLQIAGPLSMKRGSAAGTTQPQWSVFGDRLGLVTSPDGNVNMRIDGKADLPARIVVGGAQLAGKSVSFNQEMNLIWMDHPGKFLLPEGDKTPQTQPAAASGPSSLSTTRQIQWLGPPTCTWQGGMFFDGSIVHIKGDVEFDGQLRGNDATYWIVKSTSDELKIYLTNPVDMKAKKQPEVTMDRLELVNNVNISALQIDAQGTRKNYEHITVPLLAFHTQENRIIGYGPGAIRSWNVDKQERPGRTVSTGLPRGPFIGSHLVFRDSIVAFLERNEVVIEGNVNLASGPVSSLEETIDLYQMQSLKLGQMLLSCDQLQFYDTSGLKSTASLTSRSGSQGTWNFHARGNVAFEGREDSGHYEGESSEIAYLQAKDQLHLTGDPRRDASIVITPPPASGAETVNLSIRKAVVDARTLEVDVITLGRAGVSAQGIGGTAKPQAGTPGSPAGSPVTPSPRDISSGFFRNNGE